MGQETLKEAFYSVYFEHSKLEDEREAEGFCVLTRESD